MQISRTEWQLGATAAGSLRSEDELAIFKGAVVGSAKWRGSTKVGQLTPNTSWRKVQTAGPSTVCFNAQATRNSALSISIGFNRRAANDRVQ